MRAVEICANVAICVAVAVADVVAAPGGVDGPVCSAVAVCVCVCVCVEGVDTTRVMCASPPTTYSSSVHLPLHLKLNQLVSSCNIVARRVF